MKFVCVDDYEEEAFKKLPKAALDYYRSGADEEVTLKANRESFKKWKIMPRFLRDVSSINMNLEVFGDAVSCPIGASPSAMHKLAHPDGELGTAEGISSIGSIMILSTLATVSMEELANKYPKLVKWFQLYLFTDRDQSLQMIRRAENSGFKAIVFTVDAPKFGTRRRDVRNSFKVAAKSLANFKQDSDRSLQNVEYVDASIKWSDLTWLCKVSRLPVIVKGILTPEDSLLALGHGASGIIVSNHGGRQLDGVPATIEVLGMITRAVNGRCPIFVDGGIRTGTDAFKCLALGATMVFVGRPVLWGLACAGAKGVRDVMALLRDELELTMRLSGCPSLKDISAGLVIHESNLVPKL